MREYRQYIGGRNGLRERNPLAFGNTVVLKPSEEAPVSAGLLVAEILTRPSLTNRSYRWAGSKTAAGGVQARNPWPTSPKFSGS